MKHISIILPRIHQYLKQTFENRRFEDVEWGKQRVESKNCVNKNSAVKIIKLFGGFELFV